MADDVSPPELPPVSVAGLLVPAPLVPRIITALRKTYPELTGDMADDDVPPAVLAMFIANILAEAEAAEAQAPMTEAVEATRAEYVARGKAARYKALADCSAITKAPDPPVELPTDPQPGGKK